MNKKILLALTALLSLSTAVYAAPNNLEEINPDDLSTSQRYQLEQAKNEQKALQSIKLEKNEKFYPNANVKSAIAKYKKGNYIGCIQELYSLTEKDPSNALAYYYLAMAYANVGASSDAVSAYEKVISLGSNKFLVDYATKGRDCLTGGPACAPPPPPETDEKDEEVSKEEAALDEFINAPYGNGLSPELNLEMKKKELKNIQQTINKKEDLNKEDIQKIKQFDDKNKSDAGTNDKIASASPSDEDILNAIKTLKDAGVTVNVQPSGDMTAQMFAQNPQMAEMNLLLGNSNNNNNNMMNMIPFMMAQSQSGKNIDPRVMQAMIMNSMMPDFGLNNDNNRY